MTTYEQNRIKHPELYPALKTPGEYAESIKSHCDYVSQLRQSRRAKKIVKVCLKFPPF